MSQGAADEEVMSQGAADEEVMSQGAADEEVMSQGAAEEEAWIQFEDEMGMLADVCMSEDDYESAVTAAVIGQERVSEPVVGCQVCDGRGLT